MEYRYLDFSPANDAPSFLRSSCSVPAAPPHRKVLMSEVADEPRKCFRSCEAISITRGFMN